MGDYLDSLRDEILYYIESDFENEQIEFKAQFKFATKHEQAEFIRDILSLANYMTLDPPKYSYLIFGAKSRRFLIPVGELSIEESNVRSVLDAYVYPPLAFDFFKFVNNDKEIGVFRIEYTGSVHFVNKEFKENGQVLLSTGNSWTRRGSQKTVLSPEMYARYLEIRSKAVPSESELQVCIYNQEKFTDRCTCLHAQYGDSLYIHHRINELLQLKETIGQYELTKQPLVDQISSDTSPNVKSIAAMLGTSLVGQLFAVKIPRQEEVVQLAEKHLNVSLTQEFFDLGALRQSQPLLPFTTPEYKGTEEEKSKYELLERFVSNIRELDGLLNVFEIIDGWYALPLVLRNVGSRYEEDIDVSLEFPSEVRLIEQSDFPIPNDFVVDVFVENDGALLNTLVSQQGDFQVQRYDYVLPARIPLTKIPTLMGPSVEELQDDFRAILRRYMKYYDIFKRDTYQVLNCHFKYLKHGSSMAFPMIIFLQSDSNFVVKYTIRSKHHSTTQVGELSVFL